MAKKFIIVRVLGGLGNQLFVFSFARYLSLKLDRSVFLETRTGFLRDTYKKGIQAKSIQYKTKNMYLVFFIILSIKKTVSKNLELIFGNVTFMNGLNLLQIRN